MNSTLLDSFASWLKSTAVSETIIESSWIWPASETLHFMGLAMLIGTVGLADLRMLGLAPGLRFAGLHKLIRWGIAGFVICAITGAVFFVAAPSQYVHNVVFQLKLLCILLAGLNALIFELKVLPQTRHLGPGDAAPATAKAVALISLCLWIGVMFLGRMLPFMGEAF